MANTIKIKSSSTASAVPLLGDIALGELAINTYDGILFFKKNDGTEAIVSLEAGLIDANSDGVTYGRRDGAWVEAIDTLGGQTIGGNISLNGTLYLDADGSNADALKGIGLTSSGSANSVLTDIGIQTGFNRYYNTSVNHPNASWGTVITIKSATSRGYQTFVPDTEDNEFYFRNQASDGSDWLPWHRVLTETGGQEINGTLTATNFKAASVDAAGLIVESNYPYIKLYESDQSLDEKHWRIIASGSFLTISAWNDIATANDNAINISRVGYGIDYVDLVGSSNRSNGNEIIHAGGGQTIFGDLTLVRLIMTSNSEATETDIQLSDNANIATTQNLNFFIDSNNTQTDRQFSWRKNSGFTNGSTTLMTLNEAGVLELNGNEVIHAGGGQDIAGSLSLNALYVNAADPRIILTDTESPVDNDNWHIINQNQDFIIRAYNDNWSANVSALVIKMTGTPTTMNMDSVGWVTDSFTVSGATSIGGASFLSNTSVDVLVVRDGIYSIAGDDGGNSYIGFGDDTVYTTRFNANPNGTINLEGYTGTTPVLQIDGNDVIHAGGGQSISGQTKFTNTGDVNLSGVSGALIIGGVGTAAHIAIGSNEIMAKASATTTSTLNLNINGGSVFCGGALNVNGTVDTDGIKFPAAQVASTDANTLDDYEEGTFTPHLNGTETFTSRSGKYTKVGNKVLVEINILINVIGTGSTFEIYGLPFPTSSSLPHGSVSIGTYGNLTIAVNNISGILYANSTKLTFRSNTSITSALSTLAVLGSGTEVKLTAVYTV